MSQNIACIIVMIGILDQELYLQIKTVHNYNSHSCTLYIILLYFTFFVFSLLFVSDLATTYSSKHNDYDSAVEKHKLLKPTSSSDVNCGKFVQISIISLTVVIASW